MELELIIILAVAVGFWMGNKWATWLHVKTTAELLRDLKITNKDLLRVARDQGLDLPSKNSAEEPMDEYEIIVEKHGDELYAFKVDGEFLGQGKDRDSLVARIAERYSNVRFTVKEGKEYLKPDEA